MGIVLFAIIGANLKLGAGYWICYGAFCALKLASSFEIHIDKATGKTIKEKQNDQA